MPKFNSKKLVSDVFSKRQKARRSKIQRPPFPKELDFFERNPKVAGMATRDNRVITNPFNPQSEQERRSVVLNEQARLLIRNNPKLQPSFELTKEQNSFLDSLPFYKDASPVDRQSTIAGRLISGDPSAGKPTSEQLKFIENLNKELQ